MKSMKVILFTLLLLLASWAHCAEIHDAALQGDLAKVRELVARDPALVNAKGHNEKAPLHWAAQGGHLELARFLIAKGANVNELNIQKETPLVYAAEGNHLKLAELLIAKGADVSVRTALHAAPIHYALWSGRTEMVKLLIRKGADIAWDRGTGFTLLHEAANQPALEMVELMLAKGLAVDAKTDSGATPLHFAAMHGSPEIVSLLLRKGADANAVSRNGWQPLVLAAGKGSLEKTALLLAAGARTDIRDKDSGLTVLHLAAAKGYGKICAMLVENGADINAKDPVGRTPLDYAARYRHKALCAALQARGAGGGEDGPQAKINWLEEPLAPGEAMVWYLGHSGWAVRTQNQLLVFDYWKQDAPPDEPCLANGFIVPEELKKFRVTVFASHAHGDHYSPEIFAWQKAMPKITYILGFDPESGKECKRLADREKTELAGMEIIPIESNDGGQGYFVKVDGVGIFHPGDHANRQRDFSGPFKKEIDFLADQGLKADILFTPVSGCGFGDIVAVKKGVYYTIDRLSARSVFPMHADGSESRYRDFAKEAIAAGYDVPFCLAEFAGDHFIITPKGIKGAFTKAVACAKTGSEACGN